MTDLILTNEQQAIVDSFNEFLDNDEKYFIICAPAGTGKTFLCKYLKDRFVPGKYDDFIFTATTNKAAAQLRAATGLAADTIHSTIGLKVESDFTTGKTYLKLKKNGPYIKRNSIIVVDECSMIDRSLLNFLNRFCINCKFVFVGDDRQLTPVNSGLSPVFSLNNIHRMETVVRNKNQPELVNICKELREVVRETRFRNFKTRGEGLVLFDKNNTNEYMNLIKQKFSKPNLNYKIIAYTNKACIDYSSYISKLRNYTKPINENEYYIINNPVFYNTTFIPVDTNIRVLSIEHSSHRYEEYFAAYKIVCLDTDTKQKYILDVPVSYAEFIKTTKLFARQKNWREYFFLKENYADLRMRDVSTVHKAQGSTYDEVFIDLSNLGTCTNPDTFARLLYVAVSRARNKVYLYGELPDKYGSFV